MDFKRLETKGLTGDALAFAEQYNTTQEANFTALQKEFEEKGKDLTVIEKMISDHNEEVKKLIPQDSAFVKTAELKSLETDLLKRINELGEVKTETKGMSMPEAIVDSIKSLEVKSFNEFKAKFGEGRSKTLEVKAAVETSDYTGNVSRTQAISNPRFAPLAANSFYGVPGIMTGTIDNGKSILMWTPCSYTSNVGYVGENAAIGNDDAAAGVEKYRQMAKISAKLPITTETFEDLPQFAQRLTEQMNRKASLFIDTNILSGDGNDATQPNHIYGLISQGSTAFDLVTYAGIYDKATIADLIDACTVQGEVGFYKLNTVRLHPLTASRMRRAKDLNGQPIVQTLVDGTPTIGGLRLITTTQLGVGQMLVSDDSLIQIWTKRNMELKIGQIGTGDAENDRYSAILFARIQSGCLYHRQHICFG